ncbi:MAG: class I SAM-dependent methyltransferase, partial [Nitrososphaeraceae archaeon]|nr:class I SAM-dependent methyltransferase [Nitrososphaeraceae archaeon]
MIESTKRNITTWDEYYKNEKIEKMPWYSKSLDFDLEKELTSISIPKKGIFLDLGTGPGTQAVKLANKGFDIVIGSDISETVISRNKQLYEYRFLNLKFVIDDILNSNFNDNFFDYIFDRGCFHVFESKDRSIYCKQIKRILKPRGILFLKCFSIDEAMKDGPYRFSPNDIYNIFSIDFFITSIKKTFFEGTLNPFPKALFIV